MCDYLITKVSQELKRIRSKQLVDAWGQEAIPEIAPSKAKLRMITLSWNKEDPEEVASVENMFKEYTRKGWLAFALTLDNRKKQLFSFDPELGRIQLVPLVEGG